MTVVHIPHRALSALGERSQYSAVYMLNLMMVALEVNNFAHPIHKLYSHMENFHMATTMVKDHHIVLALFVVD